MFTRTARHFPISAFVYPNRRAFIKEDLLLMAALHHPVYLKGLVHFDSRSFLYIYISIYIQFILLHVV